MLAFGGWEYINENQEMSEKINAEKVQETLIVWLIGFEQDQLYQELKTKSFVFHRQK